MHSHYYKSPLAFSSSDDALAVVDIGCCCFVDDVVAASKPSNALLPFPLEVLPVPLDTLVLRILPSMLVAMLPCCAGTFGDGLNRLCM